MQKLSRSENNLYMSSDDESDQEGPEVNESVANIAALSLNSSNGSLSSLEFSLSSKRELNSLKKTGEEISLLSLWEAEGQSPSSSFCVVPSKDINRSKVIDSILKKDRDKIKKDLLGISLLSLLEMEADLVDQEMRSCRISHFSSGCQSALERASERAALRAIKQMLADKGVGTPL